MFWNPQPPTPGAGGNECYTNEAAHLGVIVTDQGKRAYALLLFADPHDPGSVARRVYVIRRGREILDLARLMDAGPVARFATAPNRRTGAPPG